jgi:photosystem II stability/assembly factor-like uncharacterized protein
MFRKFFFPIILTTVLCGVLLNSAILADAEWTMVQVKNDNFPVFNDVYFADKKIGWVVGVSGYGEDGMIFHTEDGGATWELQKAPANVKTLSRVVFASPKIGWAVGQDGTIVATKDGGKAWELQTSKVSNWLFDVFFINENIGWAVGDTETVLKTTNGGKTWKTLKGGKPASGVGEAILLTGVRFVNEKIGWSVGQAGYIARTVDGGDNWEKQVSNIEDNLNSVFFIDENTGCAVGEDGSIVCTTDGGATWKNSRDETLLEKLTRVYFAPKSQEGWAVGTGGTILHTTDGGAKWQKQEKLTVEMKIGAEKVRNQYSQDMTSVFALEPKLYWVVGQDWVFKYTE